MSDYYTRTGTRPPWMVRAWWLPLPLAAVMIPIGVSLDLHWWTWLLTALLFVLAELARRQWRRTGRKWNRLMVATGIVTVMAVSTAGCSATYSNAPGPPTRPAVVGMEWATDNNSNQCALGLMADGSAVVASAFNWPAGAAVEWLGWFVTGEVTPPGGSLVTCWNYSQRNWTAVTTYTQCFGQPVLRSTFNDYQQAAAWVQIPSCINCNQACQGFANAMRPFFEHNRDYCHWAPLDLLCFLLHGDSAAMTDTTSPPDTQPLPAGYDAPAWDVNIPAPVWDP